MHYFTNLIYKYGLVAMFFIILIEYACFPISSEIVLPFSGAVASIQHISFFVILPLSVIAGLIGTGFCYVIGRIGGGALIATITRRFPKTEKAINSSYEKFNRNGALAVCLGRLIPLIRTYIALVAGAAKLNPVTYFVSSSIGITIWNTLLIGIGYVLRENHQDVGAYYNRYKEVINPIIAILIIAIIFKIVFKDRHKDTDTNEISS